MATIKSYTDISQSKKLAEILPLESADMCFKCFGEETYDLTFCEVSYSEWAKEYKELFDRAGIQLIPCWGLAALISVLPNYHLQTQDNGVGIMCSCKKGHIQIVEASNPVDACYKLILKLHKLNLL